MATPLLGAEGLHLEYPTRVVFDSVSLGIEEGDRIGLVGRNGDGKSSLLGMLAGTIEPQSGRITRRGGVRFGVLGQTDDLDPTATVGHSIVGDRPEHEWAGDARVRDVIGGLVADVPWDALVGELSGGQRRRVALAALLVGEWDLIALDEPTNHLDVESREALEELDDVHPHRGVEGAHGFIGQQHARRMTTTDIMGDMQLMRDQVSSHAAQPARWSAPAIPISCRCAATSRLTCSTIRGSGAVAPSMSTASVP